MTVGSVTRNAVGKRAGAEPRAIRVLLCDDDARFLTEFQKRLRFAWKQDDTTLQIHAYSVPEKIPAEILKTAELIFLDIDFVGARRGGMELARKLRRMGNNGVLIFLTGYSDFAAEGYEVQAFRYLLKSALDDKLMPTLLAAGKLLDREREALRLECGGEVRLLPLADILYMEADSHACTIHMRGNGRPYTSYISLAELERQLAGQGFARLHRRYLVNLRRIRQLQCREVKLDNGESLPVGATDYAEKKQAFLDWKAAHPYG